MRVVYFSTIFLKEKSSFSSFDLNIIELYITTEIFKKSVIIKLFHQLITFNM